MVVFAGVPVVMVVFAGVPVVVARLPLSPPFAGVPRVGLFPLLNGGICTLPPVAFVTRGLRVGHAVVLGVTLVFEALLVDDALGSGGNSSMSGGCNASNGLLVFTACHRRTMVGLGVAPEVARTVVHPTISLMPVLPKPWLSGVASSG